MQRKWGRKGETSASVRAFRGVIKRQYHTIEIHQIWESRGVLNWEDVLSIAERWPRFLSYLVYSASYSVDGIYFACHVIKPRAVTFLIMLQTVSEIKIKWVLRQHQRDFLDQKHYKQPKREALKGTQVLITLTRSFIYCTFAPLHIFSHFQQQF